MTAISSFNPTLGPKESSTAFLQELYSHPHWKEESLDERAIDSAELSPFDIISNPRAPLCFFIRKREPNGTITEAPFWADVSSSSWCFQNGNPHAYSSLNNMLDHILDYLRKGETLFPKKI